MLKIKLFLFILYFYIPLCDFFVLCLLCMFLAWPGLSASFHTSSCACMCCWYDNKESFKSFKYSESHNPAAAIVCAETITPSHTTLLQYPTPSNQYQIQPGRRGGRGRFCHSRSEETVWSQYTPQEVLRQRVTSSEPCLSVQTLDKGGGAAEPPEQSEILHGKYVSRITDGNEVIMQYISISQR